MMTHLSRISKTNEVTSGAHECPAVLAGTHEDENNTLTGVANGRTEIDSGAASEARAWPIAGSREASAQFAQFGVVVTGFKRSGTSLMMELLRRAGFAPWYDMRFERFLVDEYPAGKAAGGTNEYFFEDPHVVHAGCDDALLAHLCARQCSCKVFAYGINDALRRAARAGRVRVVMMRRAHDSIRSSISSYKGSGAVAGHSTAEADFVALEQLDLDGLADELGALQVGYEDLVASPQQQVQRLLHFLSLGSPTSTLPADAATSANATAASGMGNLGLCYGDSSTDSGTGVPVLSASMSVLLQEMVDAVKPTQRHH